MAFVPITRVDFQLTHRRTLWSGNYFRCFLQRTSCFENCKPNEVSLWDLLFPPLHGKWESSPLATLPFYVTFVLVLEFLLSEDVQLIQPSFHLTFPLFHSNTNHNVIFLVDNALLTQLCYVVQRLPTFTRLVITLWRHLSCLYFFKAFVQAAATFSLSPWTLVPSCMWAKINLCFFMVNSLNFLLGSFQEPWSW